MKAQLKVESRDLHRSSPLMNHNDALDMAYFYSSVECLNGDSCNC